MRWKIADETLIVEGKFFALSTGLLGGIGEVKHIFNHCIEKDEKLEDAEAYLKGVAERFGMKKYFGLLTSVSMKNLCFVEESDVQIFATAGTGNPNEKIGTINAIAVIDAELPLSAMLNAIITITEAKTKALFENGFRFTGTNTDAVIIAKTIGGKGKHYDYSGPASELGKKLWKATKQAIKGSLLLNRYQNR